MSSERRIYPRVNTSLVAELESYDGNCIDVTLLNLSVSGMLIEGGNEIASLKPPVEGTPLEVHLHFGLDDQAVHCHCRAVYMRRQSQEHTQLGLSVLSVDRQALKAIQQYITDKLM